MSRPDAPLDTLEGALGIFGRVSINAPILAAPLATIVAALKRKNAEALRFAAMWLNLEHTDCASHPCAQCGQDCYDILLGEAERLESE